MSIHDLLMIKCYIIIHSSSLLNQIRDAHAVKQYLFCDVWKRIKLMRNEDDELRKEHDHIDSR